jgi:predicted ATPase/class 3 adenylate cyclase
MWSRWIPLIGPATASIVHLVLSTGSTPLGKSTHRRDCDGMQDLPSGTVTFLFTDIEGSTRLLAELGARPYSKALGEHRRVLREASAYHRGIEFGTEGDAFFVAFDRASDAVATARDAQAALARGPIRVRMGIHSGEPLVTEEGYVGIDVHRAARIAAAGHGGQVLLSQATRELLDPAPEMRDLGEHRLRDLDEPERLFQLGTDYFPPLRSLSTSNLPNPISSMIGRQSEMERVRDLLTGGRVRLLTLTGPGGTGKTRLGIEAAAALRLEFPNGVFFVELAPISDPRLVVSEIAQVLGVQERGAQGMEEALIAHLGDGALLLVLDNFEQVQEAAPVVARLLRECRRLSVLVTSRTVLHLTGEQEFQVPPLELPDPRARSVQEVGRSASAALFVERARAVVPGFALTDRSAPSVAEICLRLDGLPLAIELAAARVKLLDPEALLARLGRRLPLLTGGPRDAPERHRTLRATVEWSYDLLKVEEQRLFDRLSVFAGMFTLEAAEVVAGADLDTLSSLVDDSLLESVGDARFVMLATIREYAQDRLEQSEETERPRRAHAEYFTALAERGEALLKGPEQPGWLDLLEAEHDNLRAAADWLEEREPDVQLRLTVALARFWYVRGHLSEARRRLERALQRGPSVDSGLRRRAVTSAAALALIQGDYEEAARRAEEAVEIARRHGEPALLANALSNLGAIVLAAGDDQAAQALLEESVALARQAGDERVAALAINNLGDVSLTTGDYGLAEALFEESLGLLRERGDPANVARSLFNLGAAALRLGRDGDALERLRESVTLCRVLGDKEDLAWCLEGFAALAATAADAQRAAILLGAARTLLRDMGAALKPFERQLHEGTMDIAADLLGKAALTEAMERGSALIADEAIEYALGNLVLD